MESEHARDRTGAIFFEDDAPIQLRDGITYRIPPASLKDARKLMAALRAVNTDAIILNFLPGIEGGQDEEKIDQLFQILEIAFKPYRLSRDYLDEFVDLEIARQVIEIVIGLNSIKK